MPDTLAVAPTPVAAQFPAPLQCLFEPWRHKVLWGGRGAGRSWGVARALLLIGVKRPLRVLCVRELQNSISESVHKLLSDQIQALGLDEFYEIQVNKIIGPNGTSFSFEGIKNNTRKIKSYEGVDVCWAEEADQISRASWGILIPTIRKDNSEIWITFNPSLETDYTYQRFVKSPDPQTTKVVHMTWRDNPWFPEVLRLEMEDLKRRDYDAYLNIWEGHPLQMLEGAVFAKELRRATEEHRICHVPWDNETPVDTFWDLGRRDMTAIWFAQRVAMQWRILAYFEDSQEDINYYVKECQRRPYTYGTFFLPHDARRKEMASKRSVEQIVRASYPRVQIVDRINKKVNAINAARILFPNCWFDENQCQEGLQRLRHYRYQVVDGQLSLEPLHDENSHGADAFMTLAQAIKIPKGPSRLLERLKRQVNPLADSDPGAGWMG